MILQALMLCALMAEPIHVGGNFSRDLFGAVDTRPNTWGRAEADMLPIQFNPPDGYRVHILALRGDLIAFPKIDKPAPVPVVTPLPVAPLIAPNRYAGVLMGFSLTGPEGSKLCTWCADGTIVYIQDSVSTAKDTTRAGFNYDKLDVTLGLDNALQLKLAAWLNTMEVPIHVEGSWTADVEFVRYDDQPALYIIGNEEISVLSKIIGVLEIGDDSPRQLILRGGGSSYPYPKPESLRGNGDIIGLGDNNVTGSASVVVETINAPPLPPWTILGRNKKWASDAWDAAKNALIDRQKIEPRKR